MNDKVEKLQYQHFNFGPFVFYIRLPDRIKERMLADAQDIYDLPSHEYQLAGEIEKQRRYKEETVKWFVEETSRIFQIYRAEHCKFHEIPDIPVQYEINDIVRQLGQTILYCISPTFPSVIQRIELYEKFLESEKKAY